MIHSPLNKSCFQLEWTTWVDQGAGLGYPFPTFTEHTREIINITFALRTDLNAANRMARLQINHGATWGYFACCNAYQTANHLLNYSFGRGTASTSISDAPIIACGIPDDILFVATDICSIVVENMQAGDTLEHIVSCWKVYPTG